MIFSAIVSACVESEISHAFQESINPALMKRIAAVTSAVALLGAGPALADSDHYSIQQLFTALPNTSPPPNPTSLIWVQLAADSDLSVVSRELDLSLIELSKLNEQSASTMLKAGQWLVLPENSRVAVAGSSRFVAGSLRATAPLSSAPITKDVVEIQSDQSLSSFIRDHGISLQQLKDLNPGVQLSRMLVIGSKVRVAKARPLMGIHPLSSGGASWPELPGFSASSSGSTMPVGTTYTAPDSAEKQRIREQILRRRRTEQLAAARRAEAARIARLKREEERRKRYRLLGGCTYDWSSWRKSASGVRSVKSSGCSGVTEVAVDCSNYKISKLRWSKWRGWEVPDTGFEDLVVESCANVVGSAKPTYTDSIPSGTGRVIQASSTRPVETVCTGPDLLCNSGERYEYKPLSKIMPSRVNSSLEQRYRDAIYSQQEWLRRLQGQ